MATLLVVLVLMAIIGAELALSISRLDRDAEQRERRRG